MLKGFVLDNRYEVIDILGSGGMGRVYLVKHLKLDSLWAVKEIRKEADNSDIVLAEVDVLKNLDHQALPKVIDVIEDLDSFYIVFTYIKGTNLSQKLTNIGYFNESAAVNIALQLCDVLLYLHNRNPLPVIYRDLKPSNIIIGEDESIKLIDFGTAREYKEENTQDTIFIGTRGYAAPEQYGEGQSGPYTDIYSLGVAIKQLVTGKNPLEPPYGILPVRQLNPQISKALEIILEKCTQNEISKRYQNVADLIDDLLTLNNSRASVNSRNKKTIVKTEKMAFYKQMIVSFNNDEFASELAVSVSRTGVTVVLIDISRFTPVCDFYLGIKKQYNDFCIINEVISRGLNNISDIILDAGKFIYKVNQIKGLSYLAVNIDGLCDKSLSEAINIFRSMFDFIIINTSVNYLTTESQKIVSLSDRILIADRVHLNHFDYWKRTVSSIYSYFNIQKARITYLGWLYNKDEMGLLKIAKDLSKELDFAEGILYKTIRNRNNNNSKIPALSNYKEYEKEYKKLLFYLNISPLAYADESPKGLFEKIMGRRN